MTPGEREQFAKDPKIGEIRGPDADGKVWLYSTHGAAVAMIGAWQDVAEMFSQWLGSIDYDEHEAHRQLDADQR